MSGRRRCGQGGWADNDWHVIYWGLLRGCLGVARRDTSLVAGLWLRAVAPWRSKLTHPHIHSLVPTH